MHETQHQFKDAIFDLDAAIPAGVVAHTSDTPSRRFAVYRNNVVSSLAEALQSRFPAAVSIVGEEFFRGMARLFARAHPPTSPLLLIYGDDMPAFVEAFEPAQDVPYLADVMRLEIAYTQAYHAADAEPIGVDALHAIDPERLAFLKVRLHPAVRLLRSSYPVATLWKMNTGVMPVAEIEDWTGEDALVTRGFLTVSVTALPPGGYGFLSALAEDIPLGEAIQIAINDSETFDPSVAIAGLVTGGIAAAFADEEE